MAKTQRTFENKVNGQRIKVLRPAKKLIAGEVLDGFEVQFLESGDVIFMTAGRLSREFK